MENLFLEITILEDLDYESKEYMESLILNLNKKCEECFENHIFPIRLIFSNVNSKYLYRSLIFKLMISHFRDDEEKNYFFDCKMKIKENIIYFSILTKYEKTKPIKFEYFDVESAISDLPDIIIGHFLFGKSNNKNN